MMLNSHTYLLDLVATAGRDNDKTPHTHKHAHMYISEIIVEYIHTIIMLMRSS